VDSRVANNVLGSLWRYGLGADTPLDTNLVPVMVWTYTDNKFGKNAWPPAWLSATVVGPNGTNNPVIAAGLDYFIRQATNTVQFAGTNWAQVTSFASTLGAFDKAEGPFLAAIPTTDAMQRAIVPLRAEAEKLSLNSSKLAKNELFKSSPTLLGAFQNYTNQIMNYGLGAFDRVEKETTAGRRAHGDYPVFVMVSKRLQAERSAFNTGLANLLNPADMAEYKRLDDQCLASKDGTAAWERRWRLYDSMVNLSGMAGFPLLKGSDKPMSPDTLSRSAAVLQDLLTGVNSESIQSKVKDATWKAFTNRIVNLKRLADSFKTKDKPSLCTVSLMKMNDDSPDDKWREQYRAIRLVGDSTRIENTNVPNDQELGKVALNKPCNFQLYQRPDGDPGQTINQNDWGPVWLAAKFGKPQEGDFTTWIVARKIEGGNGGVLRLKLKFDEPLMDPEQWPKD
jgi:hypothetical protein